MIGRSGCEFLRCLFLFIKIMHNFEDMNALSLIVSYSNFRGIYFDNNKNSVYSNNYHQQQITPPFKRIRKRNSDGSNPNNLAIRLVWKIK